MIRNWIGHGRLEIGEFSGLRKRMRAARRGKLPPETLFAIEQATTETAMRRHKWYRREQSRAWRKWRHTMQELGA